MPADYKKAFTEDELLLRLRDGDDWVVAALFHKHFDTLMVVAQRLVSYEAAEELVSEAFWKFWTAREQFHSEAAIYQWLKVTVRNGALNHLRSERRAGHREEEAAAGWEMAEPAAIAPEEVEPILFRRILREIESLPPQQQKIVQLFFLEELDNAAIAEQLGISLQTVKNQKVRALKVLRSSFSPEDLLLMMAVFLGPFQRFY